MTINDLDLFLFNSKKQHPRYLPSGGTTALCVRAAGDKQNLTTIHSPPPSKIRDSANADRLEVFAESRKGGRMVHLRGGLPQKSNRQRPAKI